MPITLEGSCRCGAVRFTVASHTPHPYQLCYCSICRKTAGAAGAAINIMGTAASLNVTGRQALATYSAEIVDEDGGVETSEGQRHFCRLCATPLWLFDPRWPDLVHPFASCIDTPLPTPPHRVHILLDDKPAWVQADVRPGDESYDGLPDLSIEEWHKRQGLWVD